MFLDDNLSTIAFHGSSFKIAGRITYRDNQGCYWDEYLIKSIKEPNKEYWLEYDNGIVKFYSSWEDYKQYDYSFFKTFEIGNIIPFSEKVFFITEIIEAKAVAATNKHPEEPQLNSSTNMIDGICNGKLASLEFEDGYGKLYLGEIIPFTSIK